MNERPTMTRQQEVLHSPFDIETHKQTFVSYLEVVISPEGTVEYAVPSHTDKLIEILAKQKGIENFDEAKRYAFNTAINNGYCTSIDFLTGVTGYISVWFKGYIAEDPPTKAQLNKLKELFDNGVYAGPTWDTVTPKREELERIIKDLIRLAKERDDENVCKTSADDNE